MLLVELAGVTAHAGAQAFSVLSREPNMRAIARTLPILALLACAVALSMVERIDAETPRAQSASLDGPEVTSKILIPAGTAILALFSLVVAYHSSRVNRRLKRHDVFQHLVEVLDDPGHRSARQKVRSLQEAGKIPDWEQDEDARLAFDRVCRDYDLLGLLDREKLVDQDLVDHFYAVPFLRLYGADANKPDLKKYIKHVREQGGRGPAHFWEVERFYERVCKIQHPAFMQPPEKKWRRNARDGD